MDSSRGYHLHDSYRSPKAEKDPDLRNLVAAVLRADLGRTPPPLFWERYQDIFYPKPGTISDDGIMNDSIDVGKCIDELARAFSQLDPSSWNANALKDSISNVTDHLFKSNLWSDIAADKKKNHKHFVVANVHRCIRYALMGSNKAALQSVTLMELLGRDNTISRLNDAATHIKKILEDGVSQEPRSISVTVAFNGLSTNLQDTP